MRQLDEGDCMATGAMIKKLFNFNDRLQTALHDTSVIYGGLQRS